MIHHVVGLFTHPDQEWKEIRGDQEESISHMYLTHTLILAAIPAVSAFIGTTQVGWVIGNRAPVMLTVESALWMTIMSYLAMLGGVAVMGAFIHWMARTYDANPSLARCVAFATYTATPLFIGGLAALYPHMWLGMIVGTAAICYTVYLLYVGLTDLHEHSIGRRLPVFEFGARRRPGGAGSHHGVHRDCLGTRRGPGLYQLTRLFT